MSLGLASYLGDEAINGPVHLNSNLLGQTSLESQLPGYTLPQVGMWLALSHFISEQIAQCGSTGRNTAQACPIMLKHLSSGIWCCRTHKLMKTNLFRTVITWMGV